MCVTAFNSFRGLAGLKRIDLRAPRLLAMNQILLACVIGSYALYSIRLIWPEHGGANALADDPDVMQLQHFVWVAKFALYVSLLAGTIVAQGAAAWYYASRKKYLTVYLHETPQWIINLQKKQAGP